MQRTQRHLIPVLAVVGLLLLSGCGDDGDPKSIGTVPTAPPTTVEEITTTTSSVPETTSTTVARVTTTRPPTTAAPTTTTKPPVVVEGIPQVTATPARAGVGTRVRVEGTGFTDAMWRSSRSLWLAGSGPSGCSLYADVEHTIAVSAAGRLTGEFVVPATGNCRMSSVGDAPVTAGTYRVAFTCTACFIGRFEVTASTATCPVVVFDPNSDNLASDVVATNMSCAEAEALIRKVDTRFRVVGGQVRGEADGFVCVPTAENDPPLGLPSTDFECTSGVRKVTYRRM